MITSVHQYDVPNHENLKDIVWAAIEQGKKHNWYAHASNEHTTSVHKYDNQWMTFPSLTNFIYEKYVSLSGVARNFHMNDMWINIYSPGGVQRGHAHDLPEGLASWCYFCDIPKNSGLFVADGVQYGEEGTLLLFPKDMWHEVTENNSQSTRVTVSGNIILC